MRWKIKEIYLLKPRFFTGTYMNIGQTQPHVPANLVTPGEYNPRYDLAGNGATPLLMPSTSLISNFRIRHFNLEF
jgi:hypothetical protein